MKKISLILLLFLASTVSYSFSAETEIESEVMSVDPEQEFFIIKAGADEGIELGDGLIVHRDLEKIADAYVVEALKNVSAAEVLNVSQGKEIQEGDDIIIYKEEPKKIYEKKEAGEWTHLGPKSKGRPAARRKAGGWTYLGPGGEEKTTTELPDSFSRSAVYQKGYTVETTIGKDPGTVFSYASLLLRENGYLITSSNRGIGALLAYKPIQLSLISELWSDATAKIDHRLTLSVNITGNENSTMLTMSAFKEHTQKEKRVKAPVAINSRYCKEMTDIAAKIKERSEH